MSSVDDDYDSLDGDSLLDKAEEAEDHDDPELALELYERAARELEDEPALRIHALSRLADIHDDLGHAVRSRAIAEALVAEHFDDPPEDAVPAIVTAAFVLAKLHGDAGDTLAALALHGRVIERYGRPELPDGVSVAARAHLAAGAILDRAGETEASIDRFERVIDLLTEDPDEHDGLRTLADAMANQAHCLFQAKRRQQGRARCHELIERFDEEPDTYIAETVAWARQMLAHNLGHRLHRRMGRAAEAEAAYREAIDEGAEAAWCYLGYVLGDMPGREAEEEAALRTAAAGDDREPAAMAALRLGMLRDLRDDDVDDARTFYLLAAELGVGSVPAQARTQLGFLEASRGDRDAARRPLEVLALLDDQIAPDGVDRAMARLFSKIAAGRLSRRPFRRFRRTMFRLVRACRRLVKSSATAVAIGRFVERVRPV